MHKRFLTLGALSGLVAVSLGAFGAHGLKQLVSVDSVQVFQTGVQYQIYHTLALLITGIMYHHYPNRWMAMAGNLFAFGILLFSGSLYLITILAVEHHTVPAMVGIITPVGGLFFIAAWLCLFIGVQNGARSQRKD